MLWNVILLYYLSNAMYSHVIPLLFLYLNPNVGMKVLLSIVKLLSSGNLSSYECELDNGYRVKGRLYDLECC